MHCHPMKIGNGWVMDGTGYNGPGGDTSAKMLYVAARRLKSASNLGCLIDWTFRKWQGFLSLLGYREYILVNHMKVEDVLSLEESLKRYEEEKGGPLTPEEIEDVVQGRAALIRWLEFQEQHSVDGSFIKSLTFVLADGTEIKEGEDFHEELLACTFEAVARNIKSEMSSTLISELFEQLAQQD